MATRYRFLILLILVLSLAGCFRQASDPVDVDPITAPDTNPIVPPSNTPAQPQDTVVPTIEVTVSTPVVLDTQPPTDVPPATVPQATVIPVQPTNTPITGSVCWGIYEARL